MPDAASTEDAWSPASLRQVGLVGLGELVSSLAHQMSNGLAAIVGTTQLLRTDPLPVEVGQRVDQLRATAERMVRIVDSLRLLRPAANRSPEVTDLRRLLVEVAAAAAPLLRRRGLELHVDLPDEPIEIEVIPADLQWCLLQLLALVEPPGTGKRREMRQLQIAVALEPARIRLCVSLASPSGRPRLLLLADDPLARLAWQACRETARCWGGLVRAMPAFPAEMLAPVTPLASRRARRIELRIGRPSPSPGMSRDVPAHLRVPQSAGATGDAAP